MVALVARTDSSRLGLPHDVNTLLQKRTVVAQVDKGSRLVQGAWPASLAFQFGVVLRFFVVASSRITI